MSEDKDPRYMVYEQTTMGWNPVENIPEGVTKEECINLHKMMLERGVGPNDLKISRVN